MEVSGGVPTAAAEDHMAQYRISRTLGVGSFGKVQLPPNPPLWPQHSKQGKPEGTMCGLTAGPENQRRLMPGDVAPGTQSGLMWARESEHGLSTWSNPSACCGLQPTQTGVAHP
jgi:hypothetical protein